MIDVLSLLSAIGGIGGLTTIIGVAFWLGKKFSHIEMRFQMIDRRFKSIDERFKSIDERFEQIDERFKQIDKRFEQIDERFKQIDKRFELMEKRFDVIERMLEEHNIRFNRIETFLFRLTTAIKSVNEFTIDILGYEGVLREEAVTLIKRETERILSFVSPNPLTRYEKERLRELLKKDKLTLEEAEELYEIANKVLEEHGDKIEAWKLLWYSRFWIAYNWRKMKELEKKTQK